MQVVVMHFSMPLALNCDPVFRGRDCPGSEGSHFASRSLWRVEEIGIAVQGGQYTPIVCSFIKFALRSFRHC